MGIVEVVRVAHADSTDPTGVWECVDLRAVADVPNPVGLDAVKAEPRLKAMALVANSRLWVQPVREEEWLVVCEMGGVQP